MKELKKEMTVMLALDLTEMDAVLLRYVSFLTQVLPITHVYLAHNIKHYKINDLYEDLLDDDISIDNIVEQSMQNSVDTHYTGDSPYSILLTSDDYTEGILSHLSSEYAIDLLISGNKNALQGTGAMNQKLVRMLKADLMLVPEETPFTLNRILVPTDFSAASAQCFKLSEAWSQTVKAKIQGLHVYNIPSSFYPYINTEKAIDKTEKHLKEKVDWFVKKYKIDAQVPFTYVYRENASIADSIEEFADKAKCDCLVVTAKGSSAIKSLFIGSVTNELLSNHHKMPLLVIK